MAATDVSDSRPFNARLVEQVCRRRGWQFHDLDGGAGYLFAIEASGQRVLSGSGAVCAYPGNGASAYTIARDKAFTHAALTAAGLASVPTELVFLESARRHLRAPGREGADLLRRAEAGALDFPLFVKPNRGAHGDFAETVGDVRELADYLARAGRRHDQIIVQPVITAPEYRVLVAGGRAWFQYRKADGALHANGTDSWQGLFDALNASLRAQALSPVPGTVLDQALDRAGVAVQAVAAPGSVLALPGRRNLATGGHPVDFARTVEPDLAALALAATAAIGLDVAGIDLFRPAGGAPLVLEVNANPSITSLETLGELDLAEAIWEDSLERALGVSR